MIPPDKKRCSRCMGVFPREEFHRDSHRKDGRTNHCRTCRGVKRRNEVVDPNKAPELLDYQCWMPGCCRPSLEGEVVCGYHAAVFAENGAR